MMIYLIWYSQFCTDHHFLAWCSMWLALWIVLLFLAIVEHLSSAVLRLACRVLRFFMVAARGWPPAHLDGDGDPIKQTETHADGQLSVTTSKG